MLNFLKKNWLVVLEEVNKTGSYQRSIFVVRGWNAFNVFESLLEICKEREEETKTRWHVVDMKRI